MKDLIKYYRLFLVASFMLTLIGSLFKIMHWPLAGFLVSAGIVSSLFYIIPALIKIYKNKQKSILEKLLWLLGFICFSWIVGVIYYYSEMKTNSWNS
mgnify:FL=1